MKNSLGNFLAKGVAVFFVTFIVFMPNNVVFAQSTYEPSLVEVWHNGSQCTATTRLSDGSKFINPVETTFVGDYRVDTKYMVADVNGNGKGDLIEVWHNGSQWTATTRLYDGGKFVNPVETTFVGDYRVDTKYMVVDVNGDGKGDLIEVWHNGSQYTAATRLSDGSKFVNPVETTFVGDYRVDTKYMVADVNGDGKGDLIEVWHNGSQCTATTRLSDGSKFVNPVETTFVGDYRADTQYMVADINRDGKGDLIEVWHNGSQWTATTRLSDGSKFVNPVETTFVGDYRADTKYKVAD